MTNILRNATAMAKVEPVIELTSHRLGLQWTHVLMHYGRY